MLNWITFDKLKNLRLTCVNFIIRSLNVMGVWSNIFEALSMVEPLPAVEKKLGIVFFTAEIKYTYKNRPGKICSRLHLNKTKRYEMIWAICYHFSNLKNVSNTHEGVLLLVKLQASACKFTKSNTPPWMFFTFFILYK